VRAAGRRRVGALVAIGVVAAAALVLALRPSGGGPDPGFPGRAGPLFRTFDLEGHPVSLEAFRGRKVVINFWASWCQPCRAEFPVLAGLAAAHPDVTVLGVVFQDTDGAARAFLRAEGATWPGLRDPAGQIAAAYGVRAKPGIPVSVLLGPDGVIRARHLGPLLAGRDADTFLGAAPPP
jgi:cytochrome c biogenesis protein CcmG/thiol:disulfide interchange protein DsbE